MIKMTLLCLNAFKFLKYEKIRKIAICEGLKELAHTMDRLQLILLISKNWCILVPKIWRISPRNYYTDLLPYWRHN
jgi:hypothetical protein